MRLNIYYFGCDYSDCCFHLYCESLKHNVSAAVSFSLPQVHLFYLSLSFICSVYYYYYYLLLQSFSRQCQLMVFHWSLSDSKSPQVSRTRLRILAVLSNAVIWIVSTRPPTSKSSRPFNSPLIIVPKAPITIGTIVAFMFSSFTIIIYSFEFFTSALASQEIERQ